MYKNLDILSCPLPEDIERVIRYGDLERAYRLIDLRLKDGRVPDILKQRLVFEKRVLDELPSVYPMDEEETLSRFCNAVKGFTREELQKLTDDGTCDWIYLQGKPHYHEDCVDTAIKTRPELQARLTDAHAVRAGLEHTRLLDGKIAEMKKNGSAACRFRMKTTVTLKSEAERPGERIRVYLPLPVDDAQCRPGAIVTSPDGAVLSDETCGQRTALWDVEYKTGMCFSTVAEWTIRANYCDPKPEAVLSRQPEFDTEEVLPQIRFTPFIRQLAQELAGDTQNPLIKARRFYDYVTVNCRYRYVPPYAFKTCIPEYFGAGQMGDCGMHALLFITLCRVSGIPARWQSGLYVPPWGAGMHDWARFYVEPYGWLYADGSFGGSAYRAGNLERWNFYFGNLDPWRVVYDSALQQEFVPPKKFMRYDPYDSQTAEIEYEDRGLMRSDFRVERILEKCEDL